MWWDIIKLRGKQTIPTHLKDRMKEMFRILENQTPKEEQSDWEYVFKYDLWDEENNEWGIDVWVYKKYLKESPREMLLRCKHIVEKEPLFYSKDSDVGIETYEGMILFHKNGVDIISLTTIPELVDFFEGLDEENTIGLVSFHVYFGFDDWDSYLNVTDSVFTTREQKLEALKETRISPAPLYSLTPEERTIVRGIVEG